MYMKKSLPPCMRETMLALDRRGRHLRGLRVENVGQRHQHELFDLVVCQRVDGARLHDEFKERVVGIQLLKRRVQGNLHARFVEF